MSVQQQFEASFRNEFLSRYLDNLALLERLHRLMLDVVKDEFERLGVMTINPVQALLLFNIGDNEVTAGELKSRGYYQGSNVSYNLKKLVELGYMHHQRCVVDKRSVRVRLTPKGQGIRGKLSEMFALHAQKMQQDEIIDFGSLDSVARTLKRLERYWGDQIRYIY